MRNSGSRNATASERRLQSEDLPLTAPWHGGSEGPLLAACRRPARADIQAVTNTGNFAAFASKVTVAVQPSRRFCAPMRQSAKSAVLSFQR